MITPFSPPDFTTLATRTRSNSQCRAAVLDCYTDLRRRLLANHGDLATLERCEACRGDAAALARLRALTRGGYGIGVGYVDPCPRCATIKRHRRQLLPAWVHQSGAHRWAMPRSRKLATI